MAEINIKPATPTTLEANGASALAGGFVQADDSNVDVVSGGIYPPVAKFVLTFTRASAPGAGKSIALHLRALDVDGGSDTPQPSANFDHPTAWFVVPNTTGSEPLICRAPLEPLAEAWLSPGGMDLPSGWTLKIIPEVEDIS